MPTPQRPTSYTQELRFDEMYMTASSTRQHAFCAIRPIVDGIFHLDDDWEEVHGASTQQLILYWQEQAGGAWQHRVLDESSTNSTVDCFLP